MKAILIEWNPEEDETAICFSPDFHSSPVITKADILQDALIQLTEEYRSVVDAITIN